MSQVQAVSKFLVRHQSAIIQTDLCRELFMIPDRLHGVKSQDAGPELKFEVSTLSPLYIGKLFVCDRIFYTILSYRRTDHRDQESATYDVLAEATDIVYDEKSTVPLCTPQDTFILDPGSIVNFKGPESVETTIGIFIANYLFLVYPFGDTVPYHNGEFSTKKLENAISTPLLENRISTADVKDKYINTLSLFGQSNEMICPNISEKTLTIPQSIHDLRARLVRDNKAALEAGDASVMSDIEKQLIAAYRKHLEGDSSLHFLLKSKHFDVTLKKLFLVQGMTEVFGTPGKFVFIENPMAQGWKIENLPDIFNEVRSGSYSRAVETANGGVIAKLILRVLQDTTISTPDCGTTRGEVVQATKESLQDFIWNYIVNEDGTNTVITAETIPSLVGKILTIRTPGYCQETTGFCSKCFGKLFVELDQKAFAPVANDFARTQTTSSLKAMHGRSHKTADVADLNKYLI